MPTLTTGGPLDLGDETHTLTTGLTGPDASGITFTAAQLIQDVGQEEVDGYSETWRNDGTQEVTRCFKVPWNGRWVWRDQMMGYSNVVPGANNGPATITRTPPDQIPEAGGRHLFVSDLRLKQACGAWANNPTVFTQNPDGTPPTTPAPMIAYFDGATGRDGYGIYEVQYSSRNYEIRSDAELSALQSTATTRELERCVERKISSAVTSISLRGKPLYLQTSSGPVLIPDDSGNFILIHVQAHILCWNEVPDYPADAVTACVGRVNSVPFGGAKGQKLFPPGTLLCQAPLSIIRYRHTTGRVYWRIEYSMLEKQNTNPALPGQVLGWNAFADANGAYWPAQFSDATTVYKPADLNALFRPPPAVTYQ